jgi:4-hydroxy-tetrahydrodipicolinate reductase
MLNTRFLSDKEHSMKLALLGKGKTGSKVIPLMHGEEITVFDSHNKPSYESLKEHDVILSFLPGEAFCEYLPLLLETGIPVVTGSTGFDWPKNFNQVLVDKNITWIHADNFSLGITLLKGLTNLLEKGEALFEGQSSEFSLHEIHHTQKKDAPSGTAKLISSWFRREHSPKITSERIGDEIGTHTLTLKTPSEKIELSHQALNRDVFAKGALWASNRILKKDLPTGLHLFCDLVIKELL